MFVIFTVMFSHVLVHIRDCGECCFAVEAFSFALVYRHVLCVCILCGKPLKALFTLISSLHGFRIRIPVTWGKSSIRFSSRTKWDTPKKNIEAILLFVTIIVNI